MQDRYRKIKCPICNIILGAVRIGSSSKIVFNHCDISTVVITHETDKVSIYEPTNFDKRLDGIFNSFLSFEEKIRQLEVLYRFLLENERYAHFAYSVPRIKCTKMLEKIKGSIKNTSKPVAIKNIEISLDTKSKVEIFKMMIRFHYTNTYADSEREVIEKKFKSLGDYASYANEHGIDVPEFSK